MLSNQRKEKDSTPVTNPILRSNPLNLWKNLRIGRKNQRSRNWVKAHRRPHRRKKTDTQNSKDNHQSPLDDASFNAINLGFSKIDADNAPRKVGEEFILGNSKVKAPCLIEKNSQLGHDSDKDPRDSKSDQIKCPSKLVEEDCILMGFKKQDILTNPLEGDSDEDFLGQQLVKDNWAERVNSLNSYKPKDDCPSINSNEAFEISSKRCKRYGSLANLQIKVISLTERKKRDCGRQKIKKGDAENNSTELEARSLLDSDLRTRRDLLIKETRKIV
ncbi:hypothetical protein V6N13_043272 [Hibiscus sabdariffa]